MRGAATEGKRGRNSKSNDQQYKGWGHLRPQRKKENTERQSGCAEPLDTEEIQNTQRRCGPQPSTAFSQNMLTFQAALLSRLKPDNLLRSVVWSEARACGHSGDGPAAPAPPARSTFMRIGLAAARSSHF